jgi:hypothetical protein
VTAVRLDLDDVALRRYLLGLLREAEAEAVEEAYFAHPEFWERVRGVEDDLLDDHAAGRLPADEKAAFESRYLVSPPLRERMVAARALRLAMATDRRMPAARVVGPRPTRWRVPLTIAAGLLFALAAFWTWPKRPRDVTSGPPPASQAARAETPLPPAPPSAPSAASASAAPARKAAPSSTILALSPVLLRGQEAPMRQLILMGTGTVVLELQGDPATLPPVTSALEVSVKTVGGAQVWRGEGRRMRDARRPSLLASAHVPAARLAPDDYLVALSARGGEGTLYSYFFRVGR